MLEIGRKLIANIPGQLEKRNIKVNSRQCTRLRHRRSSCTRCIDACPTRAITIQETLKIESDQCMDCGICASVCPTGALEAQEPSNTDLLRQIKSRLKEYRSITFACQRYIELTRITSATIFQINCLGRLDESIMIGAVAMGAQSVTLLDGVCTDCPYAVGRTVAGQVVQRTNALFTSFGAVQRITLKQQLTAPSEPPSNLLKKGEALSRSEFFKYIQSEAVKATALTVNNILFDEETISQNQAKPYTNILPVDVPIKRQILLSALRNFGRPEETEWSDGIWVQYSFNEKCNGCQMCAYFCPTGALVKIEQSGKLGVAFNLASCIDCRLCQDVCFLNGATLSPVIDLMKVMSDSVESFLMEDAKSALWKLSPEERMKKTAYSTLSKT